MAPVEIDTIPYDIIKNLKVAFELPLVTSAYTEIACLASPPPLTPGHLHRTPRRLGTNYKELRLTAARPHSQVQHSLNTPTASRLRRKSKSSLPVPFPQTLYVVKRSKNKLLGSELQPSVSTSDFSTGSTSLSAAPYVENNVTTTTPMVEVGYNTFKTKIDESVMPHLPEETSEKFQSNMNGAVAHLTAGVQKVDIFPCGGMDHLVGKVPALREASVSTSDFSTGSTSLSAAPYVENTVTTTTPMVEVGYNTFKTKMDESVMPHLPEGTSKKFQSSMNGAVAHLTAVVQKVDIFAYGGMDHLVGKVPALREATPELIKNTKEAATTYFNAATCFIASFSLAQVALKIVDTGLEVVEHGLKLAGTTDGNLVTSGVKKIHTTANTIRIEGNKAAGTEKAKKIEEATIVGSLLEVSGLPYIMGLLGLKVANTEPVVGEVVDETVTEVVDN